jgi:hypothetical protein
MALGCEETHGNPFRYCSCGWMEEQKPDPDAFLKKAKQSIIDSTYVKGFTKDGHLKLEASDLYIVWFVKALGNWKALISTDAFNGLYWEVTHNGAKSETYVDTYSKISNSVIAD